MLFKLSTKNTSKRIVIPYLTRNLFQIPAFFVSFKRKVSGNDMTRNTLLNIQSEIQLKK